MRESYTKPVVTIVAITLIFLVIAQGIIVNSYRTYEHERLTKEMRDYVVAVKLVYKDFKHRVEEYVVEMESIDRTSNLRELRDVVDYVDNVYNVLEKPEDLQLMLGDLERADELHKLVIYNNTSEVFITAKYNSAYSNIDKTTIDDIKSYDKEGRLISKVYSEKNNLFFMLLPQDVDESKFMAEEIETVNQLVYSLDNRHRVDILENEIIIYSSNSDAVFKTYQIRDYYSKELLIDTLKYDEPKEFTLMNANGVVNEYLSYKSQLDDNRDLIVLYDNSDFQKIVNENIFIIQGMTLFMIVAVSAIGIFIYFVFLRYYNPFKV